MTGPAHPALLGATLHAERLGDWKSAEEVARGLLEITVDVPMQPLVRIEALRLLSRATLALAEGGEGAAAAAAAASLAALEQAVEEAGAVGYTWMELLALRDMCGVRAASSEQREEATRRLEETMGRLAASREEVVAVLGL